MSGNILVIGTTIAASISCTVVANLLLKVGAGERGIGTVWPISMLNMYTFLGAVAFFMALLLYLVVLKQTALNLAQSIFALQFVMVILAAHVVLGEPIGMYRWFGIALIAAGLLVIAISPSSTIR